MVFIFFKVMCSALFSTPISVLACAIIAIFVTFVVHYSASFALVSSINFQEEDPKLKLDRAVLPFFLATAVSFGGAYFVALGFSEKFFRRVLRWTRNDNLIEQDLFWFFVVILISVFTYFLMAFFQVIRAYR